MNPVSSVNLSLRQIHDPATASRALSKFKMFGRPCTRDITSFLPGVADLETLRPLLWSEGVATGRITPEAFVAVTATNAARIFGLYPRKGTIEVGSDADLVLWDPAVTRRVDRSQLISKAGYSVYEGMDVTGWPVMTMSRGDVVVCSSPHGVRPDLGPANSRPWTLLQHTRGVMR